MKDYVERLQAWLKNQCNGDWEHERGITISTLDNPGWKVAIQLSGTRYESMQCDERHDNGEHDWVDIKIENGMFLGHGDSTKLRLIVAKFFDLIDEYGNNKRPD